VSTEDQSSVDYIVLVVTYHFLQEERFLIIHVEDIKSSLYRPCKSSMSGCYLQKS